MQLASIARGLAPFGADPDDIAVQRGIAEFRAGRPVMVAGTGGAITALPVDGLTASTWEAFRAACAPEALRLVVTNGARRSWVTRVEPRIYCDRTTR